MKKVDWKIVNNVKYNLKPTKIFDTEEYRPDLKKKNIDFKFYLFIPFILIIYLLRIFKINLRLYPNQFGHQGFDIEYFLRIEKKKSLIDIFIVGPIVPNSYLEKKHKLIINMINVPERLFQYLQKLNKLSYSFFGRSIYKTFGYEYKRIRQCSEDWKLQGPQIKFSLNEMKKGNKFLKKYGLKKNNYILLISRTDRYYLRANRKLFQSKDDLKNHEKSLGQSYRNSNFKDYKKSIEFFSKINIKSVRIGAHEETVDINNQDFFDYAGKLRPTLAKEEADFYDIFLMHFSKFLITGNSGLCAVYETCDKPILFVNCFPWPWLMFPPRKKDFYMPKLLTNDENYIYTFKDMITLSTITNWRFAQMNSFFEQNKNLITIDNTEKEIKDAAEEFYLSLQKKWTISHEEKSLRYSFEKLIPENVYLHYIKAKMPFTFLKKFRRLL